MVFVFSGVVVVLIVWSVGGVKSSAQMQNGVIFIYQYFEILWVPGNQERFYGGRGGSSALNFCLASPQILQNCV